MIRRISTKWVLSVLVAVVGPFVGFAWFVNVRVSERMSGDVVRFQLLSTAADLAERLDEEIEERRSDVAHAAGVPLVAWDLEERDPQHPFHSQVQSLFDNLVRRPGVYDYIVAVDRGGRALTTNRTYPDGSPLPRVLVDDLTRRDWSGYPWFATALRDGEAGIDFHRLDHTHLGIASGRAAGGWYLGWAHAIETDPPGAEPAGVLIALMNWQNIQSAVSSYGVRQLADGGDQAVTEDIYPSSYAWVWGADANTILAHPNRELYGQAVDELEGGELAPMVAAAREQSWGMYPDYEFQGKTKKAAFRHCRPPDQGGFGWVVGVGIDKKDIDAPVRELANRLLATSAVILGLAILLTFYIAHHTTRPIRVLEAHTRRVGHGDLETRIDVRTRDELGQLARSFNRMVAELKENREQLVRIEKEAAWREMARQVAHEIKNPLTPIALSAALLRRSYDEKSPEFEKILDRTIEMVQRQVDNMREVVRDFYAFAGEHRDVRTVDVSAVLDEVLALHAAWAEERGVELRAPGRDGPAPVRADPDELQRALTNIVSNAIEAMEDGGGLTTSITTEGDEIVIEVRDTGPGIDPEAVERLFEPYFTTRSSGTGLGLAIVRRVIEDLGGHVSLENAAEGRGAVARVVLPRAREDSGHDA